MFNNYMEGDEIILYIKTVDGMLPVSCLTDNPFSRTTGRIRTSARGSGGNETYLPTMHDYNLSFSALLVKDGVSYNDLDYLQENRITFDWQLSSSDGYIDKTGTAFITSLDLNSASGEFVSFSCTLSPYVGGVSDILVWSQDGFNIVSQDGNNEVQI